MQTLSTCVTPPFSLNRQLKIHYTLKYFACSGAQCSKLQKKMPTTFSLWWLTLWYLITFGEEIAFWVWFFFWVTLLVVGGASLDVFQCQTYHQAEQFTSDAMSKHWCLETTFSDLGSHLLVAWDVYPILFLDFINQWIFHGVSKLSFLILILQAYCLNPWITGWLSDSSSSLCSIWIILKEPVATSTEQVCCYKQQDSSCLLASGTLSHYSVLLHFITFICLIFTIKQILRSHHIIALKKHLWSCLSWVRLVTSDKVLWELREDYFRLVELLPLLQERWFASLNFLAVLCLPQQKAGRKLNSSHLHSYKTRWKKSISSSNVSQKPAWARSFVVCHKIK